MGRKRKTIRFTPENEKYLREVAWNFGSDINKEVNRIITEKRQSDSKVTASPLPGKRVN